MIYILYGIFFLSCLVLIAAVLLQPGKTDAGALFTSNVSSSAFAPRGTATVLSKVTITAAIVFMLSALLLSMPSLKGGVSVLGANPEAATEAPTEAPAATEANVTVPEASNSALDNSNGALIQPPATEAVNANSANTAPPANN